VATKKRQSADALAIRLPTDVIDPLSGGAAAAGVVITLGDKAVQYLRASDPLTVAIVDSTGEDAYRMLDVRLANQSPHGIYVTGFEMTHPKSVVEVDRSSDMQLGGGAFKHRPDLLPKHLAPHGSFQAWLRFNMPVGVKAPSEGRLVVHFVKLDEHKAHNKKVDVLLRVKGEGRADA